MLYNINYMHILAIFHRLGLCFVQTVQLVKLIHLFEVHAYYVSVWRTISYTSTIYASTFVYGVLNKIFFRVSLFKLTPMWNWWEVCDWF